jgi:hypothetical protein
MHGEGTMPFILSRAQRRGNSSINAVCVASRFPTLRHLRLSILPSSFALT